MNKVVLVVEDDPRSLKLTRDMLTISGYDSIPAVDGEQGVQIAKTQKPDLILMDIMMPKMDGYTACHALKADAATKDIPVIMVTSVGFELNKVLAGQFGAAGYITKPVDRQELVNKIKPFLEKT